MFHSMCLLLQLMSSSPLATLDWPFTDIFLSGAQHPNQDQQRQCQNNHPVELIKNGDKISQKFGTTPHMFINVYKGVHLVGIATDYTLPHAEKLKEYFKDPCKFAVAAADAGAEKSVAAPAEERKEEPAE
ncbi:hypothetical protein ZIOFF_039729 [Zingiber officinale]|uniref:Uncharacterized protein n=1 Tax=Zingiber officinale TaxID=94328 RepID=A0A8J5L0D9_ZINOF|nr:hypothetical protein ZIOFF_039729 [Zingiber officinale]